MHILVTGSTGFLGKSVVNYLKNKNFTVRALGRNPTLLAQLKCDEKIVCDLVKQNNLNHIVDGCDAIVHCAALSAPWGQEKDFMDINVHATQKLADAALEKKINRFVHISSPSIYIGSEKKFNITEDDPLPKKSINLYSHTKRMGENIILDYTRKGLQTIILRPQALFGPHDTVLLPRFLKANSKTGIPLIHGGMHKIDLTFVDNVSHAILLALNADKNVLGKIFNITNDDPVIFKCFIDDLFQKLNIKPKFKKIPLPVAYSLAHAVESLHTFFGKKTEPILTKYAIKVLSESRVLNIEQAKNILGYQPIVSMEEGMKKFVHWWKTYDQTVSHS